MWLGQGPGLRDACSRSLWALYRCSKCTRKLSPPSHSLLALSPHALWQTHLYVLAVQSVAVWFELHAARIGLVGRPSPWLVASAPPGEVVRSR